MTYEGYNLDYDGQYSMVVIKNTGSGPVPKELRGHYTTREVAKQAVDGYLKTSKGKRNAKTRDVSSG